jgi:hypothetical protein
MECEYLSTQDADLQVVGTLAVLVRHPGAVS